METDNTLVWNLTGASQISIHSKFNPDLGICKQYEVGMFNFLVDILFHEEAKHPQARVGGLYSQKLIN